MRSAETAFRRALADGRADYVNTVTITLTDGTKLIVTNDQLWENGAKMEDSVSANDVFQVGAAIINSATFVLNNIDNSYAGIVFEGASIVWVVGLNDDEGHLIDDMTMGTFYVDEAEYNGSVITLKCFDNMGKFDRAYDSNLVYPTNLLNIVIDACSKCGVTLANSSQQFPHYSDFVVASAPSGESTTYRQVLSWVAQIACCFARCSPIGELEIKWFDTEEIRQADNGLDGGIFDNYLNTTDGMTYISSETSDDVWFRINNSIDFEFNGAVADYIYIDSDSCYKFSNTQPSGHGHSSLRDVNICTRDGMSTSIMYQEIFLDHFEAIKVRWEGYTSITSRDERVLKYEIFFVSTGDIYINFIEIPTDTSYLGTTSIIENSTSSTYSVTEPEYIRAYTSNNTNWYFVSNSDYYRTGDNANGGTFSPWNDGYDYDDGDNGFSAYSNVHFIGSAYSHNVSVDEVVITGVNVVVKNPSEDSGDAYITYSSGSAGYIISIEGNEFISTSQGQSVANDLGVKLISLKFSKAEITHPSDPTIEAGDIAYYWDENGNRYTVLVSTTEFSCGANQRTVSSAATPSRNSAQRFTEATKNYVALRQQVIEDRTSWQSAASALSDRINEAGGLYSTYTTDVKTGQGQVIHYHDKPVLADSDIVMIFNDAGFFMCNDYHTKQSLTPPENPTWYGLTVDGSFIAQKIQTISAFFDYAHGGTLTLGGINNTSGELRIVGSDDQTTIATLDAYGFSSMSSSYLMTFSGGMLSLYYKNGDSWVRTGALDTTYDGIQDPSIGFSADYDLDISSGGRTYISATGGIELSSRPELTGGDVLVSSEASNIEQILIDSSNGYFAVGGSVVGSWGITLSASDKRLKENIVDTEGDALQVLDKVKVYSFDWKDSNRHVNAGFIADQIEDAIPGSTFDVAQPEGSEYDSLKHIDYNQITPYCVKAIQELRHELDALKIEYTNQVDALKSEIEALKKKLADKGE